MDERKEQLLQLIIEYYIATAQPVGSQFLSSESPLGVSAATIRNEMRDLEIAGFLVQPHTSAGRIPTQQGYRYYVDHIVKPKKLAKKTEEEFEKILLGNSDKRARLKVMAKAISDRVNNAVIVAFNKDSLYYTGIGNLFAQPEFHNYQYTIHISSLFDRCEQVVDHVYELVGDKMTILIGEENPFGSVCSLVGMPFGKSGLVAVLGPVRMQYSRVLSIFDHIQRDLHI